jgi:hypothetical protein
MEMMLWIIYVLRDRRITCQISGKFLWEHCISDIWEIECIAMIGLVLGAVAIIWPERFFPAALSSRRALKSMLCCENPINPWNAIARN